MVEVYLLLLLLLLVVVVVVAIVDYHGTNFFPGGGSHTP